MAITIGKKAPRQVTTTERVNNAQASVQSAVGVITHAIAGLENAAFEAQAAADEAQAELDTATANKAAADRAVTEAQAIAAKLSDLVSA